MIQKGKREKEKITRPATIASSRETIRLEEW